MLHITATIETIREDAGGSVMEIRMDRCVEQLIRRQGIRHVAVGLEDGRLITPLQQRKAYAMIRDISDYTGYPVEEMKEIMKLEHMTRMNQFKTFSLSDCSVTTAREFINTLMEYALKEGIILDESGLKRTDDIDTYLIQCIRYRRCCICGRDADIHHVDTIGMGNDRKKYDDSRNEICALCRIHHTKAHQIGWSRMRSMYKVYGIQKYRVEGSGVPDGSREKEKKEVREDGNYI